MNKDLTIGPLFKDSRKSKDLSLDDIATKTKININILKAFESDDVSNFPNKTYAKGFAKNIGKILTLDEEQVLYSLERAYAIHENPEVLHKKAEESKPVASSITPEIKEESQEPSYEVQEKVVGAVHSLVSKKALIVVAGLLICALITKGAYHFIQNLSNETTATAKSAKEANKAKKIIIETEKKDLEQAEKRKLEEVEKQKLEEEKLIEEKRLEEEKIAEQKTIDEEEAKKLEKRLGGKFPFIKFSSAPAKMFTIVEDSPEAKDENLLPAKYKNSLMEGKQNVFINAVKADTWLSYQSDNNKIKRFVLKKGRSILLKGDLILLFVGNLNATKIFYNNKLISAQTKTGVKSLIFPPEISKNFELPLFPSYKGIPYRANVYKENMILDN